MEFGCCCKIEDAAVAHEAGFDFIECTVVSLQPEADEAAFAPILAQYQASPIPIKAFNIFLPRDLKVTGPTVEWDRVTAYLQSALSRVAQVGAETVVFGSGGSRNIPDGWGRERAEEQLVRFLQIVADVAEPLGVTVVIEPLNRKESNVLNSVGEGAALVQRVNRPAIQLLADFYHMDEEDEPLTELTAHATYLRHVHVADTGRGAPGSGVYPYPGFVRLLKAAHYAGRVSVECRWQDFAAEAGPSVAFLRRQWAE